MKLPRWGKVIIGAILCLAVAIAITYVTWDNYGAKVVVSNVDTVALPTVTVSVRGASYVLIDLSPGEQRVVEVYPDSETDLNVAVSMTTNAPAVTIGSGGYFEPGYRADIEVDITRSEVVRFDQNF